MILLVWLPMLALLIWGKGGILDLIAVKHQIEELQEEVRTLRESNAELKKEIKALQSDPQLYEKVARERYFLKKKGEVVVYLPEKDSSQSVDTRSNDTNKSESSGN